MTENGRAGINGTGYLWYIGYNKPGEASEEGEVKTTRSTATALTMHLDLVESIIREHIWFSTDERARWLDIVAEKRVMLPERIKQEEAEGTLEGEAIYVGNYVAWMALLPLR